jgi:hypothetical protein
MLSGEVTILAAHRPNIGFGRIIVVEVFLRTAFENVGKGDVRTPHKLGELIIFFGPLLAVTEQIQDIDKVLEDRRLPAIDQEQAPQGTRAYKIAVIDKPIFKSWFKV